MIYNIDNPFKILKKVSYALPLGPGGSSWPQVTHKVTDTLVSCTPAINDRLIIIDVKGNIVQVTIIGMAFRIGRDISGCWQFNMF